MNDLEGPKFIEMTDFSQYAPFEDNVLNGIPDNDFTEDIEDIMVEYYAIMDKGESDEYMSFWDKILEKLPSPVNIYNRIIEEAQTFYYNYLRR